MFSAIRRDVRGDWVEGTVMSFESRIKTAVAAAAVAFVWAGCASAVPVSTGTSCHVGSVGGATACAGIFSGNNSNQDLDGLFDPRHDWTEILKLDGREGRATQGGLTLTVSGKAKTWALDTYAKNDPVMFVLKGGNSFAAFLMDTTVLSGTWNTLSMLKGNGRPGADLSHWSIYSAGTAPEAPAPVPLPAAALLLLGGLAGLGAVRGLRSA